MPWRPSIGLRNAILATGSLKSVLANGQIRIFPGQQPATAEEAENASPLVIITLASGAMVSGVATNGINLGTAADALIGKSIGEVWSGLNLLSGVAGWFRWYPNAFDSHMGAATAGNKIRLDGACAKSGAQMNLVSTTLTAGVTTTVDNVNVGLPSA